MMMTNRGVLPKQLLAIVAVLFMVVGLFYASSLMTGKAAHAASCTISTAASAVDATTVSCPSGWTSGIDVGSGSDNTDTDGCTGLDCTTTKPANNSDISVYTYPVACVYSGAHASSGQEAYGYPIDTPGATCIPEYTQDTAYCDTSGSDTCVRPGSCPSLNGNKPALRVIVSVVTQHVYNSKGKLTKTVKTTRGYCVYPTTTAKSTKTVNNVTTDGWCAVKGTETLYGSSSSSTINSGATGNVTPAGVTSAGSAGSGTAYGSKTFTVGLKSDTVAHLKSTCVQGVYDWKAPLPKDTVNGGSILQYYRLTALTQYKRCYVISYAPIFGIPDEAKCDSGTSPVYEHNRFTDTCRYGVVDGVHTEYAKYFDPSTCDSSWQCHVTKTKIANKSTTVNLLRNGQNITVDYGAFSVTGTNVTPDKTSYKRSSSVVDGSTPFFGTSANDPKQYFKMYTNGSGTTPANTAVKFDTYYLISKLGQKTNIQFYWASDSTAPWHIETTYKFSGTFSVKESSKIDGGVTLVDVQDDATCPDPAESALANVLRSVNTN